MQKKKVEKAMRALYDEEMSAARLQARDLYIDGREAEQVYEWLNSYRQYLLGIQHSATAIGINLDRSPITQRMIKDWFNRWERQPEYAEDTVF